ncbi:RNA polymerase sigma-70 factor, ECF subfamily [Mucilaginibacter pineti]|uniref:RNA polymerase sigma-70 factor, ECF subfamily n=1 Tax=Mucilaginibacter pineti TaxID=1391627 RepID=A0A1G7G9N5_9SPHI|nr:RNA polymerase sigma-70 factor [Mucilaginibacter pineti]SDE84832.1 RNA polymerase sigma-70 factor, ECF subfamily [Mucilaginibacter pineti]
MKAYDLYTDQELLELLRSGDSTAYTEIYHRYKFILHQHAWNKLRNKEEAQDILQEVFTNLWLKRETIHISSNLSGYLYSAVRNRILDHFSHNDVKLKYINNLKPDLGEVPTDHRVRENQLKAIIEKEIAELPPRMREVFEMSRKQHMTYKEIAAELGTSEETVKKQVSGALKVLRIKLGIFIYLFILLHY